VSTTDKTWRQISKPEQPKGTPDVALQHCKVSCRRTHSCRSKTRSTSRNTSHGASTAHVCLKY